jgi:hypothetical protein
MTTVSAGSSAIIDVTIGQKIAVSTTGEAYVDIVSGALGAGYSSKRLADNVLSQVFGPYGTATRLQVRAIAGTATYGEAAAETTSGAVASVNGKTGPVELTASDVGAAAAPYVVGAVHFDGANTSLRTAALACANSGDLSFFRWIKIPITPTSNNCIWVIDAEGNYCTTEVIYGDNSIHLSPTDAAGLVGISASASHVGGARWHSVLGSIKTDLATGSKQVKIYVNDVDATDSFTDAAASYLIGFNGFSFRLGDDGFGSGATMDMAEFWFAPGQSLLVDGDIPESVRRKFSTANNAPVDLGAHGELPTGTAPAIFFHGLPADPEETFVVNRGTGGTFALTGTLARAVNAPGDDAGFDNPMTAEGDLIIGGPYGGATRLPKGPEGSTLKIVGGLPTWVAA